MTHAARSHPTLRILPLGKRLYQEIDRNDLLGIASQLAFNFLFSLFPFLICVVALAAFLPIQGLTTQLLDTVAAVMPASAYELVAQHLVTVVTERHGTLVTLGLGVALWSASSGLAALATALNRAYGVTETRPFWKTRGLAMGLTLGGGVAALLGLAILILGGKAGAWLSVRQGHPELYTRTWSLLRWPASALVLMAVLSVLYYACPNVRLKYRFLTPGSVTGAILWLLMTLGFSSYVGHFGHYDATYGSLGGVVVLLMWLYLTGFILILGGQLNALLAARQREAEGPPKR